MTLEATATTVPTSEPPSQQSSAVPIGLPIAWATPIVAPAASASSIRSLTGQVALTVVCLLFGVLLMMQFRTQGKIAKLLVADTSANQAQIIANLYDNNANLRKEVEKLRAEHQEYQQALSAGGLGNLVADLNKYRVVNGLAEARGPGVALSVPADLRAEDVQDLINELRNAGAEALAINDQRIAVRTSVAPDRGGIALNGVHLDPPYLFEAIGSSDTLERALTRKGGLVSYLVNTYPEASIVVQKKSQLTLPVFTEGFPWRFAQPIK